MRYREWREKVQEAAEAGSEDSLHESNERSWMFEAFRIGMPVYAAANLLTEVRRAKKQGKDSEPFSPAEKGLMDRELDDREGVIPDVARQPYVAETTASSAVSGFGFFGRDGVSMENEIQRMIAKLNSVLEGPIFLS